VPPDTRATNNSVTDDLFEPGEINSEGYWNKRFFQDWIANGGRRQTAFFAEVCCGALPRWLAQSIREKNLSLFDYGCALGDALPVLAEAFPGSKMSGGDVAEVGLGLARTLHPDVDFLNVARNEQHVRFADVIYCSNTLEHFAEWPETLGQLADHAGIYTQGF